MSVALRPRLLGAHAMAPRGQLVYVWRLDRLVADRPPWSWWRDAVEFARTALGCERIGTPRINDVCPEARSPVVDGLPWSLCCGAGGSARKAFGCARNGRPVVAFRSLRFASALVASLVVAAGRCPVQHVCVSDGLSEAQPRAGPPLRALLAASSRFPPFYGNLQKDRRRKYS